MTISAIGNQSDPFNQIERHISASSGSNQHTRRAERESDRNSGDTYEPRFRPSNTSENGGGSSDAGTYQVSQFQLFSASATILLAQNGTPTQSPATPASGATSTPVAATPAAPQTLPPTTASTAPQSSTAAATGATAQPAASGSTSSTADPLQALNSALQSIGLNQQEIQAFDQVASLIQSISPTAFTDLVNAFQNIAQQLSQESQSASAPASNAASSAASSAAASAATAASTPASTSAASAPVAGSAAATASAPAGEIQIEEISIRFSALEIQGSTENSSGTGSGSGASPNAGSSASSSASSGASSGAGSGGSTGGTFDLTAFQLNVSEVNFTLPNGNASSAPPTTPQSVASTGAAAA